MALQLSGQIKLSEIAAEFGGSAPHALSEYYGVESSDAPESGQIKFSNFYGGQLFNAQWSGNSIYYSDWGIYTSGSSFYFRANGSNGATLYAFTNGLFSNGGSIGGSTDDLNGIRGNGDNTLNPYVNSVLYAAEIYFTIADGFGGNGTVSPDNNGIYYGFETSGGNMRTRNGNNVGAYIGLS